MHASKKLSAIVWVDKKPVLVMSTVAPPIHGVGEECPVVERRVGSVRKALETSLCITNTLHTCGGGCCGPTKGRLFLLSPYSKVVA